MNVCIDVGNTTICVGFYKNDKLCKRLSQYTDASKTEDEYVLFLENALTSLKINKEEIERIIYSSVVPLINQPFKAALTQIFNKEILLIGPGTKTGLALKTDNPNEIGNDLIADLVGAKEKFGYPTLIVDLGTASKILLLDKNGAFTSCVIMPGLSLSTNSLVSKAALLPEVSLEAPKTIMAKNTVEAMNAGIVLGHVEMINGLIRRYEQQLGYSCKHILAGGGAVYLKDIIGESFIYDQNLNLDGLNELIKRNEVKL